MRVRCGVEWGFGGGGGWNGQEIRVADVGWNGEATMNLKVTYGSHFPKYVFLHTKCNHRL